MDSVVQILATFGLVFVLLLIGVNFLNLRFPRIPGDIYISRPGLNFFLPFTSALAITVVLVTMFGYFFRA